MIAKIIRFFDDFNRLTNFITANAPKDVAVHFSPDDRDLMANWRRRKKVS